MLTRGWRMCHTSAVLAHHPLLSDLLCLVLYSFDGCSAHQVKVLSYILPPAWLLPPSFTIVNLLNSFIDFINLLVIIATEYWWAGVYPIHCVASRLWEDLVTVSKLWPNMQHCQILHCYLGCILFLFVSCHSFIVSYFIFMIFHCISFFTSCLKLVCFPPVWLPVLLWLASPAPRYPCVFSPSSTLSVPVCLYARFQAFKHVSLCFVLQGLPKRMVCLLGQLQITVPGTSTVVAEDAFTWCPSMSASKEVFFDCFI